MSPQDIKIHKLSNGMTLVLEAVKFSESGAFAFLIPAGAAHDPHAKSGTASVVSDLIFRGAGDLDNKSLNNKLDNLGLQRHSSVTGLYSSFTGALLADNLFDVIKIYVDVLLQPTLHQEQFELCRALALQSLASLDDDPRQKISLLVREHFFPDPLGRPAPGKADELSAMDLQDIQTYWRQGYSPCNAVIALAGNVNFEQACDFFSSRFAHWQGDQPQTFEDLQPKPKCHHLPNEGAQVHIGLMYPSINISHPDYYNAIAAVNILSGGMGSRLFTEVREKRGLCYAISARHVTVGDLAAVQCYVGSSPQQAQEALDVMVCELTNLENGITQDELQRAQVGLRASLIMQGESTAARAQACASDYYQLGRIRTLDDIEHSIRALTVDSVQNFIKKYPARNFALATVGPRELTLRN